MVISSNCKNGPIEFLNNGEGGILFESNKNNALNNSLINFLNLKGEIESKIIAKKNSQNIRFSDITLYLESNLRYMT